MKKRSKILASLLLALVMVFTLTSTAFAATVTVPTTGILKDHTFTAYQVFSGREEGGVLSDVQWGSGINSDAFLTALKGQTSDEFMKTVTAEDDTTTKVNIFASCTTAATVAKVLGDNNSNTALANKVAELAYANKTGSGTALTSGENTLADGYYLVVDTTETVGAGSAYNKALLEVVGDINITVKTDAPTVDKSVTDSDETKGEAADYNIGDDVPFTLTGTLPANYADYDSYYYQFNDTLSTGLSLNATYDSTDTTKVVGGVTVTIDGDSSKDITSHFTITHSNGKLTITCSNLKAIAGVTINKDSKIVVEYTAELLSTAEIGRPGNSNTVTLKYSNDPNYTGSGDSSPKGETPEDKVLVFTYELDVTKVDGETPSKKLKDAEFVLLNSEKTKVAKIDNGKFVEWVNVPAADEDGKIAWPSDTILTSGEDGKFQIAGLDAGTYYLKETKAPAGYNLLENPIAIVISATLDKSEDNPALTGLTIKVDNGEAKNGNLDTGVVATDVENNKGATLPETGGIGTTIFYVLGGALVIGAAVLLITKKRMNAEK